MFDIAGKLREQRYLPNRFTTELGELIHNARIESKLSQSELGELAYISQAGISQIEKGIRSVSSEEIIYLSAALNKPISYFFSMKFLRPVDETELSVLEQELLQNARMLDEGDLRKIIAQIKAINSL